MEVKETVIRLMTRLAMEHGAVNFSQGFTDEAPVYDMVWGGISAMLGGTEEGVHRLDSLTLREVLEEHGGMGGQLARPVAEGASRGGAKPARSAQPVFVPVRDPGS